MITVTMPISEYEDLKRNQVLNIRNDIRQLKPISDEYGVAQSTISRIRNGKRWDSLK